MVLTPFSTTPTAYNSDFRYLDRQDKIDCGTLEKEISDLVLNIDGTDYTIPPYGYLLQDFESHKCAVTVSYVGILAN